MTHQHTATCRHKAPELSKYRLPRTVVPRRYELVIESDPDSPDFSGQVAIDVDVLEPTAKIVVNSLDLELANVLLSHDDGTVFTAAVSYDRETEMATLSLNGIAGSGKWTLDANFRGQVNDQSSGLFCATETDRHGHTHNILCTQFEAAEARRVFPCFDEPDFKATFKLSLILPRHHMALANGNGVCSVALPGNRKLVEFEETVLMSSYLLCFTLGPIVSSDPVMVHGKELRIWTLPDHGDKTSFALEVAAFGLDYFERYFGIGYPNGNKIDLVAIPNFAWGGMENVGLVICADYVLIVDKDADAHHKQNQARIILHELAHQWFGDYVTMRWWNGLWLNESFATFMASKACQAWNPTINEWELFTTGREKAYNFDSLKNTHPIEETVENARDAIFLVDPISYEKGCSVLYQFEQFLGEEVFRKGISTYLKRHAFSNTESADLWDALEEVCLADPTVESLPIRQVMDTWISQSGHPEILVSRGRKPNTIKLSQRPFRLLDIGRKSGRVWPIPVNLAYQNSVTGFTGQAQAQPSRQRKLLLTRKNTVVDFNEAGLHSRLDWVKINAGGSGFYRVRYSPDLLKALTADIDSNLSALELHNLLADASAFMEAGIITAAEYFALLQAVVAGTKKPEWHTFAPHFQGLYSLLDEVGRKRFQAMFAGTLKDCAVNSGVDPLSAPLPFVSDWKLYNLNLSATIQKASLLVCKAWQANPQAVDVIDAALAAMILSFAPQKARKAVPKELFDLRMQARNASPFEMQTYLLRLADLWNGLSSKPSSVDIFALYAAAMLEHSGRNPRANRAVDDVLQNWTAWTDQKPKATKQADAAATEAEAAAEESGETVETLEPAALSHVLRNLYGVDDAESEAKLRALFRKYPHPPLKKEIAKALERIRAGVLARQRESSTFGRQVKQIKQKKSAA